MNVVVLIGRLGGDPEIRYTSEQTAVCNASLAVDRGKRDGKDLGTDWIRLTIFGKQGETFQRYLTKGRQVAVQGRLNTGSYQNKNGETVYSTTVIVDKFDFIGSGQNGSQQAASGNQSAPAMGIPEGFEEISDGDIPF